MFVVTIFFNSSCLCYKVYSDHRVFVIFHQLSIFFKHIVQFKVDLFYIKKYVPVTFIRVLLFKIKVICLLRPICIGFDFFYFVVNSVASNNVQYLVNFNEYTGCFRPPGRLN